MIATSALEKVVRDVWAEMLGLEDLSVDDNLLDHGADSLLASRAFERLEEALGTRLPLSAAAEHPTAREMASWIRTALPPDGPGRTLVRFEPPRNGQDFFCVHGMGGHVLVFAKLARSLADVTGFVAFESVGRNEPSKADLTIDSMADRYVRDMRQVQRRGPYFLGGYSMGGVVAFEMARRLAESGDDVGLVALLDSDLSPVDPVILEARIVEFVSKSLGLTPAVDLPYRRIDEAARLICDRVNRGRRRSLHLREEEVKRFAEIYRVNASAARDYERHAYHGRVALFYTLGGSNSHMPPDTAPQEAARRLGWTDVVPSDLLVPVPVPGDHWTLFGSDVASLATALKTELENAREPAGGR